LSDKASLYNYHLDYMFSMIKSMYS